MFRIQKLKNALLVTKIVVLLNQEVRAMQEKLLVLRKKMGISQRELASYLGISLKSYSMKERGERQFTLDEMFKLRDFFGLGIEDIFMPRSR